MPETTEIWEKAARIARLVITGIHGPRPTITKIPDAPFASSAHCEQHYLPKLEAHFASVDAARDWDRRVKALTRALATEARRIEDRGVAMREMQPARVRRVVTVGQGVAA